LIGLGEMLAPNSMRRFIVLASVFSLAVTACGSDAEKEKSSKRSKKKPKAEDKLDWSTPKPKDKVAAEPGMAAKPLGVSKPSDFSYLYGRGAKQYKKAKKALEKSDWAAVKSNCEAAIKANSGHLDAHYLLATALAKLGDHAAVGEPLSVALAGDWLRWGPGVETDANFVEFFSTDSAPAVNKLIQHYAAQFPELAKGGLFVVGRRSGFKQPKPKGKVQWATTRGELFAYVGEGERYLRLTHTEESLAAWMTAPSGDEIAFVAYSGVDLPDKDAVPLIARIKIGTIDLATLKTTTKLATVTQKHVRMVKLQYGEGDELLVNVYPAGGRWDVEEPTPYRLDKGIGKLKKLKEPLAAAVPSLEVSFEWTKLATGPSPDVETEDKSSTFKLATGFTVKLPTGEYVEQGGHVWSPNKEFVAVRTMGRPCVGNPESALFLVEATTGKFKKLYAGKANLGIEWLDNDQFVYEDEDGGLRIYDVTKREQVGHLRNPAGLALYGLASTRGAICREDAAGDEEDDTGKDPAAEDDGELADDY
jgi:hypothetical protein